MMKFHLEELDTGSATFAAITNNLGSVTITLDRETWERAECPTALNVEIAEVAST